MFIIDMTGSSTKEKKLLLSITKDEFLLKMKFHSDDEKERCINYLDLKGVSYHAVLANYIGLNNRGKIEYKKIQNLYIYDKRIRNVLFRFLSAFEEGIRAYISNHYYNNTKEIQRISRRIYNSIQQGSSLATELENLDFKGIVNLSKKLRKKELRELYINTYNLMRNLNALRELRNTVSHHRMMFVYEDFDVCYVADIENSSLTNNIKNLHQLLNPYYKEFFIRAVNDSCTDNRDASFKNSLPAKTILEL